MTQKFFMILMVAFSTITISKAQNNLGEACGCPAVSARTTSVNFIIFTFKPKPDIFEIASQNSDTSKEKTIVIEDSYNGIVAAKNAGLDVIYYNANQLEHYSEATIEFQTMEDIFNYIHS